MANTYAFDEIVVTVGGQILSGLMSVSHDFSEDQYSMTVAADGEVGRAKNANQTATVELVVLATSGANDVLSALYNVDRLAGGNGVGLGPFLLKDLSGRTVIASGDCWVAKPPAVEFGAEVGERTWSLRLGRSELFVGGN